MTPDVNVLVAASRRDHPHYTPARAWLDAALADCASGARFSLLPMVATGMVRLVTHPKVFTEPTPTAAALAFIDAVRLSPGVETPVLEGEWTTFAGLCRVHTLAGNAVPDAWIAAAVRHHREHLATFDRGFRRLLDAGSLTVLQASVP